MARLSLTFCMTFLFGSLFSQIIYVTQSGSGSLTGSSWSNAYPAAMLQQAIDEASSEVWVALGTYRTTSGPDRTISFHMRNGIAIYGSFAGTETQLSQRNLSAGLTSILTAEIGSPGISDNSYHTIHNSGLNNTAVIDGFVITGANDDREASETEGLGGGIYNSGNAGTCSPTIRNCVISNNRAVFGAGIFNSGYLGGNASPLITNCVIAFNTATKGGGGVDNFGLAGVANPVITNTIFYENTATERAGAMYCWGGNNGNASPVVVNSVFVNNRATDGGAVVSDRLNASVGSSGSSDPAFKNCIFLNNTVTGTGPQFLLLGGATFNITYSAIDPAGQTTPNVITGSGIGNISADPEFVNASVALGTDNIWLTIDDGLRLQSNSPCVNSGNNVGTPDTDILSNPRVVDITVDMGAYEQDEVVTGLDELSADHAKFFPNPASEKIVFEEMQSMREVQIFTALGKPVTHIIMKENEVNIHHLPEGMYLLVTRSGGQMTVRKLLIKR
jgi:Secretion system C-terminal sorting domain